MEEKLAELGRRFDELTARMADPEVYAQPGAFQKIARDVAELERWSSVGDDSNRRLRTQ